MQPYYSAGGQTIYLGDCRDVLPQLPRGSVDLLLTDPPYGIAWAGSNRRAHCALGLIAGDDGSLNVPHALALALPALKKCRHLYAFGRYDLTALPLGAQAELIWDKVNPGPGGPAPWQYQHEYITFAMYVPSRANRADGYGAGAARLRRGTVLRFPRINGVAVTRHPTEKPIPLLRELIESSSRMGEVVLDPFMGVGSTLVAAQLEGRQAIGIEIEERYCETAAKRLEQARQAPLPLEVGA